MQCWHKSDCCWVEVNLATLICWRYHQILDIGVSTSYTTTTSYATAINYTIAFTFISTAAMGITTTTTTTTTVVISTVTLVFILPLTFVCNALISITLKLLSFIYPDVLLVLVLMLWLVYWIYSCTYSYVQALTYLTFIFPPNVEDTHMYYMHTYMCVCNTCAHAQTHIYTHIYICMFVGCVVMSVNIYIYIDRHHYFNSGNIPKAECGQIHCDFLTVL